MASPTFTHRFRPLTSGEVGRLIAHLANSGTTFSALTRFTERMSSSRNWHQGPWVIPLPGASKDYYVIGEPPDWLERIPEQQELTWPDDPDEAASRSNSR